MACCRQGFDEQKAHSGPAQPVRIWPAQIGKVQRGAFPDAGSQLGPRPLRGLVTHTVWQEADIPDVQR